MGVGKLGNSRVPWADGSTFDNWAGTRASLMYREVSPRYRIEKRLEVDQPQLDRRNIGGQPGPNYRTTTEVTGDP